MRHGSLFSGIGGFDLAAEWMGWDNIFHCEWNKFGQRVLKYHFPKSISYHDITKTDFTIHRGQINVLTGGFPCQPYSQAGKRLGKADDRHLWPEMLRAIREIQPTWVVGENVRGLTNWNGGMVFDEVQADLEAAGYEVTPFLLPACAVNAPHRRDRIWFVAYRDRDGRNGKYEKHAGQGREYALDDVEQVYFNSDTDNNRLQRRRNGGKLRETEQGRNKRFEDVGGISGTNWENFPTQSPVCGGDDGLPRELDGITFSKWREESIKAYGNAIVPQVALQIFKAIQQYQDNG